MKFDVAVADANIFGHLYRSNAEWLLAELFDRVLIDHFIMEEIERKQSSIIPMMQEDFDRGFLQIIRPQDLDKQKLYELYKYYLDDMRYLFLPTDEGEKRGIALAKATGTSFFLTDDENYMEGPYYAINRGIISGLAALAFWDLLYIGIIVAKMSVPVGKRHWDEIVSKGYEPPYRGTFGSKMGQSVRRFKDTQWFTELVEKQKVDIKHRNYMLLTAIRDNGW
ncbi:MAG: hypothetical protein PHT79_08980 [Syntrophomonadaceae bacterium]|nr:hypothetical protein [Syntrophomonadaceae bacterium]MDD3889904.1 hypothetical protein [Syntrophomonadaceae bacterium]MDD4549873.1 hypothetical protein [Syntrophomonadaceae bacterium]